MVVLFLLLFSEGFLPWRLNGWLFLILNGRKNVGCLNDDDKSALSLSPFLPSSIFFSVSQYIESTNLCGFNKTSDEPFLLFLFFDCQTICRFNWNIIIHLCVIRKFIKMKKETTKNETYIWFDIRDYPSNALKIIGLTNERMNKTNENRLTNNNSVIKVP